MRPRGKQAFHWKIGHQSSKYKSRTAPLAAKAKKSSIQGRPVSFSEENRMTWNGFVQCSPLR